MEMDVSVKEKLQAVANALEASKGELRLFACIWRSDVKKWDIIVSADWIDYQKLQENIGEIFDVFKTQFNGEFALRFTGIYPLTPNESLVRSLTQLFSVTEGTININDIQISDVRIEKMVLVISRPKIEAVEKES